MTTIYKLRAAVHSLRANEGKALGPCGMPRGREGAALGLNFLNSPFPKECGRETDRQTDVNGLRPGFTALKSRSGIWSLGSALPRLAWRERSGI